MSESSSTLSTPAQLKDTIDKLLAVVETSNERLSQRTCDTLMGLCIAWQTQEEYTEKVLQLMQHHGLKPEHSTYRSALKLCYDHANEEASQKLVLREIDCIQMDPRPTDIGLVVSTLCKSKEKSAKQPTTTKWRQGWEILQAAATTPSAHTKILMTEDIAPNLETDYSQIIPAKAYNDVLLSMKRERVWKDSVKLLQWMEDGNCGSADTTSANSAPNKESTDNTPRKSIVQPYGFVIPSPSLSTYQIAVETCLDSNQIDAAIQILHDMHTRNIQPKTGTFQIILSALSQKRQWKKALQLLETMIEMDVPRTATQYNTVIGACAKAREVGMAKHLLQKMKKDSIRPDVVSYNSVICACANTARWKEALEVLDQSYREPGVTPNIFTYTSAMRACAKGGKSQRALSLLQVVKDKGLPLDSYCYTAVIDACAKGGMWEKALALFDEMEEKGIEPTEVTYSVTISALGNGLQWERALWLLNVMRDKKMPVNLITYNAAITALAKSARENTKKTSQVSKSSDDNEQEELWPKALGLLNQMKEDGIEPDGFCYSSAINCCGSEGRWKEACKLIEVMRTGGPKTRPNKIAYTAAIGACGRAGQSEMALELFETMASEGLKADRVAYNALFSALRIAKNPDKAFDLWNDMCNSNTSRCPLPTQKQGTQRGGFDTSPDIITVSDCIATLSDAGHLDQMDAVFQEAVKRGIVLRGNALDGQWEVDLSRLQIPVARAAVRYLLEDLKSKGLNAADLHDMTFITGVGKSHEMLKDTSRTDQPHISSNILNKKDPTTSLRDFIQAILETDFQPGLKSIVPERAKGTVVIETDVLLWWLNDQRC
jgi:pentatricopeptide repeat domain-containing protein 1